MFQEVCQKNCMVMIFCVPPTTTTIIIKGKFTGTNVIDASTLISVVYKIKILFL